MPDHFHAIVWLPEPAVVKRAMTALAKRGLYRPPRSLGSLIGGWKGRVTSLIGQGRLAKGWHPVVVWQRNYYDHIIRDDCELESIRAYIRANPQRWAEDNHFV